MSIEAEFVKEFKFLDFSHCISTRLERSSKNQPKYAVSYSNSDILEDYSFLAEKQQLKPKFSNFLDAQLDPMGARLVE